MSRLIGITVLLAGLVAGTVLMLQLDVPGLAWSANLAGLAVFVAGIEVLFSPSRLGSVAGLLEARGAGGLTLQATAGLALGAVLGALSRLVLGWLGVAGPTALVSGLQPVPPGHLIPVFTFLGLLVLLGLADFVFAAAAPWRAIRQRVAEDHRAKIALVLVSGLIDVVIVSVVQARWVYLLPVAGLVVLGGLFALSDVLLARSRIWAVARHMIAEGIRMKIALVFIAIIVVILPVMPFTITGDGLTLKSRVQSFLAYSLGSVGFLLSLLTVFLSCSAISNEISQKHIVLVVSKPIPRWQFFAGKWVGISVLNAGLLIMAGLTVWGFTAYLSGLPTSVPDDRAALEAEVLNVRYGAKLADPPNLTAEVDNVMRRLREDEALEGLSEPGRQNLQRQKEDEIRKQWYSLGPGEVQQFEFRHLLVDPRGGSYLHLHFKPIHASGAADVMFKARWQAGDRRDVNTLTNVLDREFIVDRFHSIPVPARAVNAEGTLYLTMMNMDARNTITFEGADSFELLYDIGTFHWNLMRALSIIWCRLAFTAVVGLLASSFLSFPVACMGCLLVLGVASSAGFLAEAIDAAEVKLTGEDPLWVVGPLLRPLGKAFVWLVPDFSKFDPVGTVVAGRVVPLKWVLQSLAVLLFLKGLVLGILGCVVLSRREVAQVTV